MNVTTHFKILVCATCLALAGVAAAAPVTYNITVSGAWFDTHGNPYGMSLSPTLTGEITVDSTIAGIAGMLDFSLATGSRTWTETDFPGTIFNTLHYNLAGDLAWFDLNSFIGAGRMYINSSNTMAVFDPAGAFNACNSCVSFARASEVSEPATLALIGLGLLGAAAARRRT